LTLHDLTLHDLTLHDLTLHDLTLHDLTLRDLTLRDLTLRDTQRHTHTTHLEFDTDGQHVYIRPSSSPWRTHLSSRPALQMDVLELGNVDLQRIVCFRGAFCRMPKDVRDGVNNA
jgi:hypothetical protein